MSRSFKLTLAYDGTHYAGWQVQPGERTIQGVLQRVVSKITREDVQVVGSGRTDSGVHAIAQVASCQLSDWQHTANDLRRAINANLPETIFVTEVVDASLGFHAIYDAVGKRYRYQLQIGGDHDVFQYPYRWHIKYQIDLDVLRMGASRLLGRHDFASFQASGSQRKTTERTIFACDVIDQPTDCDTQGMLLNIEVEADGFLYNMVRNIVGTLVEVGRGRHTPDWIDEVLVAKNRCFAGQTAPSHALFLLRVDYPESVTTV